MQDYDLHLTNYVLEYFRHLLTGVEKGVLDAIVMTKSELGGQSRLVIVLHPETDARAEETIRNLLAGGVQVARRRVRDRLIAEHSPEVFANACPSCARLPRTPMARYCPWCKHNWRERESPP